MIGWKHTENTITILLFLTEKGEAHTIKWRRVISDFLLISLSSLVCLGGGYNIFVVEFSLGFLNKISEVTNF